MNIHISLKQHALELLEQSKSFLQEDGDLDPTAFIITRDDQLLRPIESEDESSKIRSCRKILTEARRLHALAIITIFIARWKNFDSKQFAEEGYSWGDLQQEGVERCIFLTLSGPGIMNWAAAIPFENADEGKRFGKLVEFNEGVDIGLFPGWSDDIKAPNIS